MLTNSSAHPSASGLITQRWHELRTYAQAQTVHFGGGIDEPLLGSEQLLWRIEGRRPHKEGRMLGVCMASYSQVAQ